MICGLLSAAHCYIVAASSNNLPRYPLSSASSTPYDRHEILSIAANEFVFVALTPGIKAPYAWRHIPSCDKAKPTCEEFAGQRRLHLECIAIWDITLFHYISISCRLCFISPLLRASIASKLRCMTFILLDEYVSATLYNAATARCAPLLCTWAMWSQEM